MKRGQIVQGIVERVDFPAKGIVRVDSDNTVAVKNVLPGQKVTCRVKKVRHGDGQGMLISVDEKAENEIVSPCPHFGECGGCAYMNLSYEDQLALKEAQVKDIVSKALSKQNESYEWMGIKASPKATEYRNKMEFTFGDEYMNGPLALGMHKRGGFYDIVTVKDCLIVDEDYRKVLRLTLDYFAEKGIPYYHRMRHEGYLRHLLVRRSAFTDEMMVALVTSGQADSFDEEQILDEYKDKILNLDLKAKITGVLHTRNDSLADTVQSDHTDILYGRDYITENLLGLKFNISEFSFFQTNSYSAEVLYSVARDLIGELGKGEKIVYDLYSGTGTIAQLMAPVAKKVIGVEIVEEAVEAAKENARLNGLDNLEFIAGDVLEKLDEIKEKPDFIILDPPRDGVHPKALHKIINYGVDRLIYISCKPTSLARDLESFLLGGYVVTKAVAVDQFPATSHAEVCCLLEQLKSAKEHIEITIDAEDYYRIKNSEKKTE